MNFLEKKGFVKTTRELNLRKGEPSTNVEVVGNKPIPQGAVLEYVGWVTDGEDVRGNLKWFKDPNGNYFWSGNVTESDVYNKEGISESTQGSPIKFLKNPLDSVVCTQKFGLRPEVYGKFNMKGHNGMDFRTVFPDSPDGRRNVYAVLDGVVSGAIKNDPGYGNYVRLRHIGTSETIYAHLHSLNVKNGQQINAGDLLGIADNTGFSEAPHLHFGYRPDGFDYSNGYKGWVDPEPYFGGDITHV